MTCRAMQARGLTLIEIVVSLGLFSLLLSGSFAGAYALAESARRAEAHAMLAFEGAYLLDMLAQGTQVHLAEDGKLFAADDPVPLTRLRVSSLARTQHGTPGDNAQPASVHYSLTLHAKDVNGRDVSRTFSRIMYENAP